MIKNCLICEKEINRTKSKSVGKLKRGPHAVTCSKQCTKIYTRVYRYVHGLAQIRKINKKEID